MHKERYRHQVQSIHTRSFQWHPPCTAARRVHGLQYRYPSEKQIRVSVPASRHCDFKSLGSRVLVNPSGQRIRQSLIMMSVSTWTGKVAPWSATRPSLHMPLPIAVCVMPHPSCWEKSTCMPCISAMSCPHYRAHGMYSEENDVIVRPTWESF
jgi:hypothetical protein